MDKFNYKTRSRSIAIIDLVLSSIGIVYVLVIAIIGTVGNQKSDVNADSSKKTSNTEMYTMWGILGVASVIVAIHLYIAIKFLKASSQKTDYKKTAKWARYYKNLNIVFITLSFLNLLSFSIYSFVGFLIGLIFRGLVLYFVCNFIKELDGAIATPISGNPDNVVVNK